MGTVHRPGSSSSPHPTIPLICCRKAQTVHCSRSIFNKHSGKLLVSGEDSCLNRPAGTDKPLLLCPNLAYLYCAEELKCWASQHLLMLHMSAFVLLTCSWWSWVKLLLDNPVLPFNNKNRGYGALHKYRQQTVDLGDTMLAFLLCTNDNKYCADYELVFSYYREGECWKQKPCFPALPSLHRSSMCRTTWRTLTTKITGKTKGFTASSRLRVLCARDKCIITTPHSTVSPKVLEFKSWPNWSATSAHVGMLPVFFLLCYLVLQLIGSEFTCQY